MSKRGFSLIYDIYQKAKTWIIGILIVLLVFFFYFGNSLVEITLLNRILVAVIISILAILFELLMSISKNLGIRQQLSIFPSIYEALPIMKEIIKQDRNITTIKIIAATGGTTLSTILPSITASSGAKKIDVAIGILDPDTPYKKYVPAHWSSESKTSFERLNKEYGDPRISINAFLFELLPVPHGILINDKHLFLGFFGWIKDGEARQLTGAQLPHHYYNVNTPEFAYYSSLFESWFLNCPRKLRAPKLLLADFDGTLVDSYISLHNTYDSFARRLKLPDSAATRFVAAMIKGEDDQDALQNYDRHIWWPSVLSQFGIILSEEQLKAHIELYWDDRTAGSKVIEGSKIILDQLKQRGCILAIVCGSDGKYGNKKKRIENSLISSLFDEIVIIKEDVENVTQAAARLMKKNKLLPSQIMLIDDKPFSLNEIAANVKEITTVKIDFQGILTKAWQGGCLSTYRISDICQLKEQIDI